VEGGDLEANEEKEQDRLILRWRKESRSEGILDSK